MLTFLAFLVAISLLIAVHECGHFFMALACNVRVLRFSIGFGRPVIAWTSTKTGIQFVMAIAPLGGYVKLLDEREAPVEPSIRHLAFNNQTWWRRCAIVIAGPAANLVLAVVLYAVVHILGVQMPAAILAPPLPNSIAANAGMVGGEMVLRGNLEGQEPIPIQSFEDLHWLLVHAVLESCQVQIDAITPDHRGERSFRLSLPALNDGVLDQIGIPGPLTAPVINEVTPDSPAMQAGLMQGDRVLQVNDVSIVDGAQLRRLIRTSTHDHQAQTWQIQRNGRVLQLNVTPAVVTEAGQPIGHIGAYIGQAPEMVTVRYGLWESATLALHKTWELSTTTLATIVKIATGAFSTKNISGPITIAAYAGQSADAGLSHYLTFLALVSVSLGVLNLLPIPILDGGHLVYYLWEGVTGRPVSGVWLERLQLCGMVVLGGLMVLALYNDLTRFWFKM